MGDPKGTLEEFLRYIDACIERTGNSTMPEAEKDRLYDCMRETAEWYSKNYKQDSGELTIPRYNTDIVQLGQEMKPSVKELNKLLQGKLLKIVKVDSLFVNQ